MYSIHSYVWSLALADTLLIRSSIQSCQYHLLQLRSMTGIPEDLVRQGKTSARLVKASGAHRWRPLQAS